MKFPDWLQVFGNQSFRGPCAQESQEQIAFFDHIRATHPEIGLIALHQRNEGKRSYAQARWQKREGLTAGASDIIIPGMPTFVCEMKRKDHTKSSWKDGQIDFLKVCKARGCYVSVALGYEGAIKAFNLWLVRLEVIKNELERLKG